MSLACTLLVLTLTAIGGAFGWLFSALCMMREDVDRLRHRLDDDDSSDAIQEELDEVVNELERWGPLTDSVGGAVRKLVNEAFAMRAKIEREREAKKP